MHIRVTIGNDRKTERKMRNTFVLFLFFWEGSTRDKVWRGAGGGCDVDDNDEHVGVDVVGESCPFAVVLLALGFGSPINGR